MAAEQPGTQDIFLEYCRDGIRSTGNLVVQVEGKTVSVEGFEQDEYSEMLTRLARVLSRVPNARVVLRRTDCPKLFPYVLDQETVELFRTDPVSAIRSMTFEIPEAVVVKKTEDRPVEPPPLRVGYDTLADAFGDLVYLRTRGASLECPGCGMWGDANVDRGGRGIFSCQRKCLPERFEVKISLSRMWAAVSVGELLSNTEMKRFFLPRSWNDSRSWISREELETKYVAFRAEKERACNLLETV